MERYSEQYKAKCIRRLKEWNAPLDGWYCNRMYDVAEDDESSDNVVLTTCELCGCSSVRFVHVMRNRDYFEDIEVGCICAGIMAGNILGAKARDNDMKNRARRKRNFPKRTWKKVCQGVFVLVYRGKRIFIYKRQCENSYSVQYEDKSEWRYKGQPITNFLSATYAAFELVDPVCEECK